MASMEIDSEPIEQEVSSSNSMFLVDDKNSVRKNIGCMEREEIISFLDKIDNQVEELRREAVTLGEKRDNLMTRIDMMKHVDLLTNLDENDRADVNMQLKRINARLQTVDVNVQTVRDHSQVDSLHVVNHLIDEVIRFGDPISKRRRCQEYLNACSSSDYHQYSLTTIVESSSTVIDKKFEGHLLGCTLDDQKRIKKRLENLLSYMANQMVKISD